MLHLRYGTGDDDCGAMMTREDIYARRFDDTSLMPGEA